MFRPGHVSCCVIGSMRRGSVLLLALLGSMLTLTAPRLAGAPAAAPAAAAEYVAVERFLTDIEKPPVGYRARRRMDASSLKLRESAWMEVLTTYEPAKGFNYQIIAQGGSERIRNRVLTKVLEAEQENSTPREWSRGVLSRGNYEFNLTGRTSEGLIKVQLNPRRRDSRLVNGVAVLAPHSGGLLKVEGRLSKSPSFWVRWVDVSRRYTSIAGIAVPISIESTADVRIAGVSTFAMSYDYEMIDGQAVGAPRILASR
jgi:hypothetical protein